MFQFSKCKLLFFCLVMIMFQFSFVLFVNEFGFWFGFQLQFSINLIKTKGKNGKREKGNHNRFIHYADMILFNFLYSNLIYNTFCWDFELLASCFSVEIFIYNTSVFAIIYNSTNVQTTKVPNSVGLRC